MAFEFSYMNKTPIGILYFHFLVTTQVLLLAKKKKKKKCDCLSFVSYIGKAYWEKYYNQDSQLKLDYISLLYNSKQQTALHKLLSFRPVPWQTTCGPQILALMSLMSKNALLKFDSIYLKVCTDVIACVFSISTPIFLTVTAWSREMHRVRFLSAETGRIIKGTK